MIQFWLILSAVAVFAFVIGASAGYYSSDRKWIRVLQGIAKTLESQNRTNQDILTILKPSFPDPKQSQMKTADEIYQTQRYDSSQVSHLDTEIPPTRPINPQ